MAQASDYADRGQQAGEQRALNNERGLQRAMTEQIAQQASRDRWGIANLASADRRDASERAGKARDAKDNQTRPLREDLDAQMGNPPPIKRNRYQSDSFNFGNRMEAANGILDELAAGGTDRPSLFRRATEGIPVLGAVANSQQTPEQQQVEQAQRDFINATLRRESGAAISDGEFSNAQQQYLPVAGDSPEVVAQKRQNRIRATTNILASAGGPQAAPAAPTGAPNDRARAERDSKRAELLKLYQQGTAR